MHSKYNFKYSPKYSELHKFEDEANTNKRLGSTRVLAKSNRNTNDFILGAGKFQECCFARKNISIEKFTRTLI